GAGEGAPAGAVLLPREVGVDAGHADPHRVAPRPPGPPGRDDEGAAAVDAGVDDPVTAVAVTDRWGVEPAGRLGAGAGPGPLCGAVQHVADLLPVHQVLAVEQRQSGDVLEAGAHQVVVVADPAHARIGVEPADHRVVVEVHGTCSLRGAGQRPLRHDGRPVRAAARTAAALTLSGAVLARDVSGAGPALVVAVGAGVDLDLGAVGGAGAHGVQALAGLDADDGTVGVQTPLLVVAAPAAVDLDLGAVAGAGGVQALVAVDPELTGAGQRPLLVGAVVAVVELDLGAVGRAGVGHVQAAARGDALDGGAVTGLRVRVRVAAGAPVAGVQHGAVRLLLAAVVAAQQRSVLRPPGVAAAAAPAGAAEAAWAGQDVVDRTRLGGRRGALDVELGDGHVDPEGGELPQRGAEVAVVGAAAVEVRLEADAVDRHAALLEVPHHAVHGLGLGPGPVLDVVVVVAELGGRVGGPRGAEGDLDPVAAAALQVGVAPGARTAVGERLVHHVPLRDLALVVGHHAVDVVDHRLAQRAAVEALHPAGLLGVPGQRVAAHLLAVLHRPVVDAVAGGEVELAPLRLGGVDLHLVLGRHRVELTGGDRGVRRVVQPVRGDGDAEVAAALGRGGTEGALGGLGGGRRDERADQTD